MDDMDGTLHNAYPDLSIYLQQESIDQEDNVVKSNGKNECKEMTENVGDNVQKQNKNPRNRNIKTVKDLGNGDVFDCLMGCDLGNICAKAVKNL
jgi:hypothetical protein